MKNITPASDTSLPENAPARPSLDSVDEGLPDAFFSAANVDQVIQAYRLIFQNHPTPMWIYDLNTLQFLAVNNAAVDNYGYRVEEFRSMTIKDIRPKSEIQRLIDDIARGRQTRVQNSGIWLHQRKDGSLIQVHIVSQSIENEGSPAVLVTARDVTEQLATEEKLRQLNRLYTILSDVNQSIVRVRDLDALYQEVCRLAVVKGAFTLAWISLVDDPGGDLRVAACQAETEEIFEASHIRIGQSASAVSVFFGSCHSTEPIVRNEMTSDCASGLFAGGLCGLEIRAFAVLPLLVTGQIRGTLNLFSHQPGIFDQKELALLKEMAMDISFAIEHAEQEQKRREAELDLKAKTEELDRYFNSSLDMLCIADTGGHFRRLNPEWEKALGYPLDELIGKVFLDYVHPDDVAGTLAAMATLSDQTAVLNFENRYRCKDGSYRWIEWRSYPYGDIIYAAARDITEHKLREEKLRQSQQNFASFMNNLPGAAFIKDHDRRFVYVSQDFEKDFNVSAKDWIGHTMEELVPGAYTDEIRKSDEKVIESGAPLIFEFNTDPGKKGRWLLTTLFPVIDITGRIGVGGFSLDVSELKKREHEVQTLFDLSTRLRSVQTREEIIDVLVKTVRQALDADSGQVILPDDERQNFIIAGVDGHVSTSLGHHFPIGEGMSSWVWKNGQTYVSEDYATDPHHSHALDENDLTGPSIFTPLRSEEDLMGVLFVSRLRSPLVKPFAPEDVRLFSAIGEMAGIAMRRVDLFTDALRRLKHVQSLRNIDLAITGNMDLSLVLDLLLSEVKAELQVDAAGVMLLDETSETLKFAAGQGFKTNLAEKCILSLGKGLGGEVALERTVKSSRNLGEDEHFMRQEMRRAEDFVVYFGVPMISKGKVLGIMEVFHRSAHPAIDEWQDLLVSMAGRAAIAVDNARMINDLQQSNEVLRQAYDATILGWSRAMDLRDEDTEGHTQRVTEMTLNLARSMGITEDELIHVRRGALLHDMGKLGVPDNILRKPGPLTDEEWAIMRCHPLYTYDMLSPIEFLRPALDIPFFHHEKWDGSGYPSGLEGDNIPLSARIFAIIDVYDALTSDRPYRKAWPVMKALEHIRQGAGSHFDPQVVTMFLRMMGGA
jgi:PAS domain S-box-containing protein